ncbi:endonuclease/exonuclease/phosphatase family protein [Sphaerisporangium viridialbum]|uniref:endonuclease/exonuclease/phosphatase family protein n=1 Tax=Sphaerisporangium viridialbum TaxID=46189 RepID=UPI003C79682B
MGEPAAESTTESTTDPMARAGRAAPLSRLRPGTPTGHQIAVIALALGVLLLTDVLRVFLPSLITLFGRAGDTPPEQMGMYAALRFVLPLAAAPLSRLVSPRLVVLGGAILLAADRLLLQATDGGSAQLYVASAGVSFGLVFLYGCALTSPRTIVPAGLAAGLAASAIVHLALGQLDLVWRDGPLPWLAVLVLCAAFAWSVRLAPTAGDVAPAGVWLAFGPFIVLHGMYLTTVGLADYPGGSGRNPWETALIVAALVCAQFLMVLFAARPPRQRWIMIVQLPLTSVILVVSSALPLAVLMAPALGACFGMAGLPGARSPRRSGLALLGGMLVFLASVFLYYAAYDTDLGFANSAVPGLLTGLLTVPALLAGRGRTADHTGQPRAGRFEISALSTAAVVAALTWQPLPAVQARTGDEFTLVAYNIRMGFGLKGTLDLDKVAAWARSERPDVVLLSEVDRGWLLNGGHDDLARIARGLGMRYHFAPAADSLWGDAIITNLPIRQIASHPLGGHDYPTGAQAQAVVVEVGGKEVGIVNTHLQAPPGQAPEVAAIARDLAAGMSAESAGTSAPGALEPRPGTPTTETPAGSGPRPVLLAGDLNTTPTDPEMRVLEAAGLSDPLTALGNPNTSPADDPVKRIDHVLVSRGLTAVEARVPRVGFSDHLPVVVRLRVTRV